MVVGVLLIGVYLVAVIIVGKEIETVVGESVLILPDIAETVVGHDGERTPAVVGEIVVEDKAS